MRYRYFWLGVILLSLFICRQGMQRVNAQAITASTPTQLTGVGVHTSCLLSTVGQSNLCLAGDGLWISSNGGVYMQVGIPVASGVTSVNGKTGAVTIAATTTLQ